MGIEMHPLLSKDIQEFITNYRFGDELKGSCFLVTGATGLIGSTLIHCLLALEQDIHIIAPVRNIDKALNTFSEEERRHIDIVIFDDYFDDALRYDTVEGLRYGASAYDDKNILSPINNSYRNEVYRSEAYRSAAYRSAANRSEAYRSAANRSEAYRNEVYRSKAYRSGAYRSEAYRSKANRSKAYRSEAYRSKAYRSEAYRSEAYRSEAYRRQSRIEGAKPHIVDFIIHCAAPTSSRYFVEHAVETSTFIYNSTLLLLQFAQQHPVKGFVYLSSLEVYGQITDDSVSLSENQLGYTNPLSPRSSYPMAKLTAENLCCSFAHQHGVPTKIARLTQTTGIGVTKDDNRVINQFARLAALGQDIVLHTTGESARPYCYTLDAVDAILTILLRGKDGEAYNVANGETYISARDMAECLRDNHAPAIQVRVETDDTHGYAPETKHRLSTVKLQQLGWQPRYGLQDIFNRIIPWFCSSLLNKATLKSV